MNRNLLNYFLQVLTALGSYIHLHAQDGYQHKTFTTNNGLTHNHIYDIVQDRTGFLWIATWDGLNRFDGLEFKNYYHKPNDSASLPFFCIDKVLADHRDNIWVFSSGRPVVIYDRASDSFHSYNFGTKQNLALTDIAIGPDKNLWFTVSGTLCKYNIDTKQFKSYKIECENNSSLICCKYDPLIAFDNLGNTWLYYLLDKEYYIFKSTVLNDSTLRVHQYGSINLNQYPSANLLNYTGDFDFYISESGKTWLFSKYGLFNFDKIKGSFVVNKTPIEPDEFKGKSFYIWTDEKTGIHVLDTKNKSLTTIEPKNENFTETVFIDKTGIIWSGDINSDQENIGLNRYVKSPDYFTHYLTDKTESNLVFPVLKDKNHDLWVGTRNSNNLIHINSNGFFERVKLTSSHNQPYPKAKSLAQDTGGIWIGTTTDQLFYYDFVTKKSSIKFTNQNLNDTTALSIHNILCENNVLTINGGKGIYRYLPETNSLRLYFRLVTEGTCFSLVRDGRKGYWLGTWGNIVIHLDAALKKTAEFKLGSENNLVEHICPGDSNDIWVALMGGGLGHLYPQTGKIEIFTTADGLSNNVTYSIVKDKKGYLWISTNQGLSRFNPRTKQFRNYNQDDGLLITEFNSDSYFQAHDGEIFFGGVGGMVSFYPDSINNSPGNTQLSPLIITEFKVSGTNRYFDKAVNNTDTLQLEKGDNNFQISFACLNFRDAEKIKYRYRLQNITYTWTETDSRNRNINFTNLTHQNYKLEIQATNENGEWVNKKYVVIKIPHSFTELLWVRIVFILLAISGIILIVVVYIRQLGLKAKQLQAQLRLESLRGQMNPHFIFNSLNSINYFISKEDKLSANHYIADFSRLIRSILTNLSSDYITFEKEMESLHDYLKLEHLRFSDKFNYSIHDEAIENTNEILVFPGMIQPFIENAIWHGVRGLENRKGYIRIIFLPVSTTKIQCIIEDDGIGRKMSQQLRNAVPGRKSQGIGIVMERLRIINTLTKAKYQLTIEDLFSDRAETGTKVTIEIPIKKHIE